MGLRQGDLKDLVYHIFEIDSYASKMGADKNIVTLSFSVKDNEPAKDLVKFLEGGYSFILDAVTLLLANRLMVPIKYL